MKTNKQTNKRILANRLLTSEPTQILISYRNVIRIAYDSNISQMLKSTTRKKKSNQTKEVLRSNATKKYLPNSKTTSAIQL